MILALLLLGCPTPVPPTAVFPVEPPAYDPVPELQAEAQATDCPEVEPFNKGETPPYTQGGRAACYAQVVPPVQLARYLYNEEIASFWRWQAEHCRAWRLDDRATCQRVVDYEHNRGVGLEKDVRALRWAVPAAALGGLLVGVAVGVLADTFDEAVP